MERLIASRAVTWRLPSKRLVTPWRSITRGDLTPPGRQSDTSRAAKPDRHAPIVLDDDRDFALTFAVRQHPVEIGFFLLDVHILERDMPPLIVVTGGLRVRSRVFAEDVHHHTILRALARAARESLAQAASTCPPNNAGAR